MGVLCAIAAAIAAARLNGSTLDIGMGNELYVIAAAVDRRDVVRRRHRHDPGRHSLAHWSCSHCRSGMSFLGVDSPVQNIVVGIVLVPRSGFDTLNRRRGGGES